MELRHAFFVALGLFALVACASSSPSPSQSSDGGPDVSASQCPARLPSGACDAPGLSCSYDQALQRATCLDGEWLACGDAIGIACRPGGATPAEGSRCCENEFSPGAFGGATCCAGTRICKCTGSHVHCTDACGGHDAGDTGVDASADATSD